MSLHHRLIAWAEHVLSERTFQLIVSPAVADLQFEEHAGRLRRTAHRLAVLRALAGATRIDVARACSGMWLLMLVPAAYYLFLLVLFFDIYAVALTIDFLYVATLIVILSLGPVAACFLPERRSTRSMN
jgi:hypothetical protein